METKTRPKKNAAGSEAGKKMKKGDKLVCNQCGFSIVVGECCDVSDPKERMCCDEPMCIG